MKCNIEQQETAECEKRGCTGCFYEDKTADETWRDIEEYGGDYQISNLGRVRNSKTNKILKPSKNNKGYYMVSLNGKTQTVHRLVAKNFIDKLVVNHKNGIKTDNRIENLELISQKDNVIKAWNQKLCENIRESAYTQKHSKQIKTSKAVTQIDLNGNVVNTYVSIRDAERQTGIRNEGISRCCKGKRQTAGGYRWIYYKQ